MCPAQRGAPTLAACTSWLPPADEDEGDVPQVPLEELLEDLAALGLEGEAQLVGSSALLARWHRALKAGPTEASDCACPAACGFETGLSCAVCACPPTRLQRAMGTRRTTAAAWT